MLDRFPFVCVSIGLTIGKEPVVGVVYNPIINEVLCDILTSLMSWEQGAGSRELIFSLMLHIIWVNLNV